MRDVSLGNTRSDAGGKATVDLLAPESSGTKIVNITYDADKLKPLSISGRCEAIWKIDAKQGRIGINLPAGCTESNLTFEVSGKAQVNDTIRLNVTGTSGFRPERIINGTITITANGKGAKKSPAMGTIASLAALAGAWAGAVAIARRRR
jgi:hypothetical protein